MFGVLVCLRARVLGVLTCLRARRTCVPGVPTCLRVYVLGVFTCLRAWRAYVLACLRVSVRACYMKCLIFLRVCVLGVLFCLICFAFQHLNLKILTAKICVLC